MRTDRQTISLPDVVGRGYGTFWNFTGRYRVCKGSRASKKSKTTALNLITRMMAYPHANLLVVRKVYRTLKDSCFAELKWAVHRLDANGMETEYQAAFEELIWFVTCHIANTGGGDFTDEPYELIFNRDILISESSAIADCRSSVGILSNETIVANHPWVDDVEAELARLAAEKEQALDLYGGFGQNTGEPPDDNA